MAEIQIEIEELEEVEEIGEEPPELYLRSKVERLKKLNATVERVGNSLSTVTQNGKKRTFDEFDDKGKAELMSHRSNLLSAMSQANSILNKVKNKIKSAAQSVKKQLAGLANNAMGIVNQIFQKCITMLSQFNKQMQIDSITLTIGITISVSVTIK